MRKGRPRVALILTTEERQRLESFAHRSRPHMSLGDETPAEYKAADQEQLFSRKGAGGRRSPIIDGPKKPGRSPGTALDSDGIWRTRSRDRMRS